VSQKAIELPSSAYKSALEDVSKKTRIFNSSWKLKAETAKENESPVYSFRQISVL
jgi:hypothetical protein